MFESDDEVEVRGLFADQRGLVKAGSVTAFVGFVVFGAFVPAALVVAVAFGVGTPATNWQGTVGALAFTVVLAALGGWLNCRFLNWLKGGTLSVKGGALFVAASMGTSVGTACIAAAAHVWPQVFLASIAVVVASLLLSSFLIKIGSDGTLRRQPFF